MSDLKKTRVLFEKIERAKMEALEKKHEEEILNIMDTTLLKNNLTPSPAIRVQIATELVQAGILNRDEMIDFINNKFGNKTEKINSYSLSDLKERLGQ